MNHSRSLTSIASNVWWYYWKWKVKILRAELLVCWCLAPDICLKKSNNKKIKQTYVASGQMISGHVLSSQFGKLEPVCVSVYVWRALFTHAAMHMWFNICMCVCVGVCTQSCGQKYRLVHPALPPSVLRQASGHVLHTLTAIQFCFFFLILLRMLKGLHLLTNITNMFDKYISHFNSYNNDLKLIVRG